MLFRFTNQKKKIKGTNHAKPVVNALSLEEHLLKQNTRIR